MRKNILLLICVFFVVPAIPQSWQSQFITVYKDYQLFYNGDDKGNTIPDFSSVGFASGEKEIPNIQVKEVVEPVNGDNRENIQQAINKVAALPMSADGFRGAVLLKMGTYEVEGSIVINASGIVIRGEGADEGGTIVREIATKQVDLFCFKGIGDINRMESTKVEIAEDFVPTGRKWIVLSDASQFQVGDLVLLFRPGTDTWIHDLKMDQIVEREGTRQWEASDYNLYYERCITHIEGNKVYFDNPVVMQIDKNYGGGYLMKYSFNGRIENCGIENLLLKSTFQSDTDEDHGWIAVNFSKVNQGWVQNVVSKYFGYSCVFIDRNSRNISVLDSKCLDAKSQIIGGRRYSFNCNGQLNLFKNCYTSDGRHDYVTGSQVCGPNVFTQCKARSTHADIGPHHRWASGTLYDMIDSDGSINVQDRGNWGSGHGWAGVTQVLWNCRSPKVVVQSPWVSGKNYCIGLMGEKTDGRFNDRPNGKWEGLNQEELYPESLYDMQLKYRLVYQNSTQSVEITNINTGSHKEEMNLNDKQNL